MLLAPPPQGPVVWFFGDIGNQIFCWSDWIYFKGKDNKKKTLKIKKKKEFCSFVSLSDFVQWYFSKRAKIVQIEFHNFIKYLIYNLNLTEITRLLFTFYWSYPPLLAVSAVSRRKLGEIHSLLSWSRFILPGTEPRGPGIRPEVCWDFGGFLSWTLASFTKKN